MIGDIIRKEREQRKLTQDELAKLVGGGVKQQNIAQVEDGTVRQPRYLNRLLAVLNLSYEDTINPRDRLGAQNVSETPGVYERELPLITFVQAGSWTEVEDPYSIGDFEKTVKVTKPHSPNSYALRIEGDSMQSDGPVSFPDGWIITIDPDKQPENGSFVVVRLEGDKKATFKQLVIDGDRKYLKPLNERYPVLEVNEEAVFCGVLKQLIMEF